MLAGREAERARIASVVDAARRGSGSALVIRGMAGTGKSALLADVVAAVGAANVPTSIRSTGVPVVMDPRRIWIRHSTPGSSRIPKEPPA